MPATPLGQAIPSGEVHAVSVSLPTWEDCCDYERGSPRVVNAMQIGYPRFFVHKSIQEVSNEIVGMVRSRSNVRNSLLAIV